jgi:hypothetical protein
MELPIEVLKQYRDEQKAKREALALELAKLDKDLEALDELIPAEQPVVAQEA